MKAANKHALILSAATKVFAKKGFFNARISDIAKEAKIADGTIYLYFNNKHDILISIFEKELGAIHNKTQEMIEKENNAEIMLRLFISNYLRAMKKNKFFARVLQLELRQTDKQITEYRNNQFAAYINMLSSIIVLGQEQDLFRSDLNPDIIKRTIYGALEETSRVWNISLESHYSLEDTLQQLVHLILSGLRARQSVASEDSE